MQRKHYIIVILVALIGFGGYFFLLQTGQGNEQANENLTFPQLEDEADGERIVEMETSMGTIKIRLFEDQAPKAVENFLTHSEDGYYDGTIFHRIVPDTVMIGGDPTGTGRGGESIYGEFFEDEISKELYNLRGAVAMHNSGPNTNTSQFFIVQNKEVDEKHIKGMEEAGYPEEIIEAYKVRGGAPWLDGVHTVFGQVIEGMDVVEKICSVEVDKNQRPLEEVKIEKITVIQ